MAVDLLFVGTEVTVQRRATKFIIKRCAAQRTFGHDIQRTDNTFRFTEILFPGLFEARDPQVGNGKADQARFGFRAAPGGTLIANFTAGTGGCTRPRGNRRRVVVRFHLHQNMRSFLMEAVFTRIVIGKETADFRTFHYRRVVFIGGKDVIRRLLEGVFNHFEQRLRLFLAVNDPVGVENFVAAMFRVSLREHIQFDIVGVAAQTGKGVMQIINFIFCQRQAQTNIGLLQRGTPLPLQIDALNRRGLMVGKQLFGLIQRGEDGFHHTVMEFCGDLLPLRISKGAGFNIIRHAALKALNGCQAAVVSDISGLGRPGGDGARTRRHND